MSNFNQHNNRAEKVSSDTLNKSGLIASFKSLPQKKLLVASCLLHVVFFSLLFINWQSQDAIKPIFIPENIQARVVSSAELDSIRSVKEAEQKMIQDKINKEKQKAEENRRKLLEKEQNKKREKDLANKKLAEQKKKKKKDLAEKQLIKKKKDELLKAEKEKKLKEQKKAEEEKLKAEKEQKLIERKIKEEKIAAEQAKELKEQEQKMLDRLKHIEQQNALADQHAKKIAQDEERVRQEKQFLEYELSEQERYMARIKTQIEGLWNKPPKSENLKIILSIKLLPNGELSSVHIITSSGVAAFDRSALLAVKSVRRFLVPSDIQIFERNFRQFTMSFLPE